MKTLALAMIVRNEERCLERCLRSAEPFVDQMIVVDTGSTDRTIEIAKACGAQVFHRRWTDDFAAARNAALTRSSADYNLILDADEWIESGGELLGTVREARAPKVHALKMRSTLRSHTSDFQSFNWLARLLPRGVRYAGRVHEQPHHRLPVERMNVSLGHDGYVPEHMLAKRGRNRSLLLRALADKPDDAYVLYQLGKDNDIYNDAKEAVEYYWKALELVPEQAPYRHDLVMRLLACLPRIGQSDKALTLAADEMPKWQHSADFHYLAAEMMFEHFQKYPSQGRDLLPMIEQCLTTALKLGDTTDLSGSLAGRGSYLAADKLWALHTALKQFEKAEFYANLRDHLHQTHKDSIAPQKVMAEA